MPWELSPDRISLPLICDSRCELREAIWCLHVSIWGNKNSDCKNWVQHRCVKFNAILEKYRLYRTHFFTIVWIFFQILFSYISSRHKCIHFDLGRHVLRVGFKKKALLENSSVQSSVIFIKIRYVTLNLCHWRVCFPDLYLYTSILEFITLLDFTRAV